MANDIPTEWTVKNEKMNFTLSLVSSSESSSESDVEARVSTSSAGSALLNVFFSSCFNCLNLLIAVFVRRQIF